MATSEEIFDEYTKRYGGIYKGENEHIRRIKSDFEEKVYLYKDSNPNYNIPSVYLGFINYDKFHALAFKQEDKYFIGISIGTIRSLENFFNFLFAQPYFLKDFGNAEVELEQKINLVPQTTKFIDYFNSYDFEITPKSGVRKHLAYQTFYKAINYLIMHEFAHITHGHLDYNVQTDQNFMLFEEDIIKSSKTNIRKALEYDADSSATTLCILPHPFFGASDHNTTIEIRQLNIAAYFLFKLPSLIDYKIEDFPFKTYPSPDQRLANHLSLVATYLLEKETQLIFDVNPMIDFSGDIYLECLTASSKMFNYDLLEDKSLYFFSQQGYGYLREIHKSWNQIRDDLQGYAYVQLAPKDSYSEEDLGYDYDEIMNKRSDKNVDSDHRI